MKPIMLLSVVTSVLLLAPASSGAEPSNPGDSRPVLRSEARDHSDVAYRVIFRDGDQVLGNSMVGGLFGQEVQIEVSNAMRVTMVAARPDRNGLSVTSARMAIFKDNAWQPAKEMSMVADLSATPSFEYSVEGTTYRFVVMPRLVVPASA